MRQILRFYIYHDFDLIALRAQGISLRKLGKEALESYANGRRIKVRLEPAQKITPEEINKFLNEGKQKAPATVKIVDIDSKGHFIEGEIKRGLTEEEIDDLKEKGIIKEFFNGRVYIDQDKNKKKPENKPVERVIKSSSLSSFKCEFTTKDEAAIKLLSNIKKRYRNQFIKTLIRNALTEQSLVGFFTEQEYIDKENSYLKNVLDNENTKTIELPTYESKVKKEDILVAHGEEEATEEPIESRESVQEVPAVKDADEITSSTPYQVTKEVSDSIKNTMHNDIISPIEDLTIEPEESTEDETDYSDLEGLFNGMVQQF